MIVFDQAVSGASNALPMLVVARYSSDTSLGNLAVAYATIPLVIGLTRSVVGEPLLAGQITPRQRSLPALLLFLALTILPSCAVWLLVGGEVPLVSLALILALPTMVCQDLVRMLAFSEGRVGIVLLSDTVRLASALASQAAIIAAPGTYEAQSQLLMCGYFVGSLFALVMMVPGIRHKDRSVGSALAARPVPNRSLARITLVNTVAAFLAFVAPATVLKLSGAEIAGLIQNGQLLMLPLSLLATALAPMLLPAMARTPSIAYFPLMRACAFIASIVMAGGVLVFLYLYGAGVFPLRDQSELILSAGGTAVAAVLTIQTAFNYLTLRVHDTSAYFQTRLVWVVTTVVILPASAATGSLFAVVWGAALIALLEFGASTVQIVKCMGQSTRLGSATADTSHRRHAEQ